MLVSAAETNTMDFSIINLLLLASDACYDEKYYTFYDPITFSTIFYGSLRRHVLIAFYHVLYVVKLIVSTAYFVLKCEYFNCWTVELHICNNF